MGRGKVAEMNKERVIEIAREAGGFEYAASIDMPYAALQRNAALLRAEFIKEMGEPMKLHYFTDQKGEPKCAKLYKLPEAE
jgi:hypothetical protein